MKKILTVFLVTTVVSLTAHFFPNINIESFAYTPAPQKSKVINDLYEPDETVDYSKTVEDAFSNTNNNKVENYTLSKEISSKTDWQKAINYCIDNLVEEVSFEIKNFDEDTYNLKSLNLINASISAEGKVKQDVAEVTYKFSYKENYLLNKAAQNKNYLSKLTSDQLILFNKVKSITNNLISNKITDFEKEQAIHDYIVANSKYSQNINKDSYTIRNLIYNGSGVCEAYAYTFQMMCTFANINCEIITGKLNGQEHGWNIVQLDGEYYHIDVTSDDPVPDKDGQILYKFFNVTDKEISKTHTWNTEDFPKCVATKYNYFVYNNLVVTSKDEMEKLIMRKIDNGETEIYFYVSGFEVSGASDFKFCNNGEKNISSFYLVGSKSGAFLLEPRYVK